MSIAYKVNGSVWTVTYSLHMVKMIDIQCVKKFLISVQHVRG